MLSGGLAIFIGCGGLVLAVVAGATAFKRQLHLSPQPAGSNKVWSRIFNSWVVRYSEHHVLEELFWGNNPSISSIQPQLGMNGIED